MFHKSKLGIICGSVAVALIALPASAQTVPEQRGQSASERASARNQDPASDRRSRSANRNQRSQTPSPAPSPEQNQAAAQTQLTAAGKDCQVTQANLLGMDGQQQGIYEAACSSGPGYIIVASTPPVAVDCLELAGTAATARARNPEADVGQQCSLPANDNGLAVLGGWARDAGATCTVDQALAVGKSSTGNMIYEIGCAGQDGYWLEKTSTGWDLQDCMQVVSSAGVCNFTTAAEQASGFKAKLTGTDAATCDVQTVRLMGRNANGRFYEAKCAAGDGYIARLNNEGVTQQVYPCATAQAIGGGCTLTTAAPTAAAGSSTPTNQ